MLVGVVELVTAPYRIWNVSVVGSVEVCWMFHVGVWSGGSSPNHDDLQLYDLDVIIFKLNIRTPHSA